MTDNDRNIIESIFQDRVQITHETSDRYAQDILDAIKDLLQEYDELVEIKEMYFLAEKHIKKLEAMLDRRKERYKKFNEVI